VKVHKLGEHHVGAINAHAGAALDRFVMDPENVSLQLQLAHRLRRVLLAIDFPVDQPASRAHVGRLLRLAGVPEGMIKFHAQGVVDFLAVARKPVVSRNFRLDRQGVLVASAA